VSDSPLVFPVAGEVSGEGLLLCRMRVVFGRAVCEEVVIPFNLVKVSDQFERYMDFHRLIRDWRGNVPRIGLEGSDDPLDRQCCRNRFPGYNPHFSSFITYLESHP